MCVFPERRAQCPEPRAQIRETRGPNFVAIRSRRGMRTPHRTSLVTPQRVTKRKRKERKARSETRSDVWGDQGKPFKKLPTRGWTAGQWTPQPLRLEVGDGLWLNYGRLNTKPYGFKAACDPRRTCPHQPPSHSPGARAERGTRRPRDGMCAHVGRVVEIISRSSLSSGVCMDDLSTCRAARHRTDGRRGTSGDAGCSRGPLVK